MVELNPADPVLGALLAMNDAQIIKYLRQFTKWRMKHPLTPEDYRWVEETLKVSLTSTATTGTKTYHAPANYIFLLFAIEGYLVPTAPVSEVVGITGLGNPDYKNRLLIKSTNVLVDLQNADRDHKLFGTAPRPLSSILPVVGGTVKWMQPPYVVPDGEAIQLDLSMASTNSEIVGAAFDAGVSLYGLQVRTRE